MIRKLISITPDLERMIKLTAMQEKKPEAAVVREKLRAGFAATKPTQNGGDSLLKLAAMAVKSDDPYLSRNIDTYLYEDP